MSVYINNVFSVNTEHFNPFTPESDQCQNSPAASQEIWHHTVWRTWLFIAYSDYTTNSRYITHTIAFWKVGRIHFLTSGVKGLTRYISSSAHLTAKATAWNSKSERTLTHSNLSTILSLLQKNPDFLRWTTTTWPAFVKHPSKRWVLWVLDLCGAIWTALHAYCGPWALLHISRTVFMLERVIPLRPINLFPPVYLAQKRWKWIKWSHLQLKYPNSSKMICWLFYIMSEFFLQIIWNGSTKIPLDLTLPLTQRQPEPKT